MRSGDDDNAVVPRRRLGRSGMAAISPLPPPQEVFIDWLMSVPHGADLEAEARRQVGLIDRRAASHPDLMVLRALLAAIAGPED